ARARVDRDKRQEAVLPGEVELRVYPLDLEESGNVGIDVEASAGVGLAAAGHATRLPAVVAGESAVVRPHLAVAEIEFDAYAGLGQPDGELEVRPEAGPGVPLAVTVT